MKKDTLTEKMAADMSFRAVWSSSVSFEELTSIGEHRLHIHPSILQAIQILCF